VDVEVGGVVLRAPSRDAGRDLVRVGDAVELALRAERVNLRRGAPGDLPDPNLVDSMLVDEHAYGAGHTLRFEPVGRGPALEVDLPSRPYEVLGVAGRKHWTLELPVEDLHLMPVAPGA
jgi:hypothetical protein